MRLSSSCLPVVALLAMSAMPASAQNAPSGDWRVDRIDGKPLIAGSKVTLRFDAKGRVSGMASCNRFSATFSVAGERLSIGPAVATRMACQPEIMAQERQFLQLLEGAANWRIEGGRLIIAAGESGVIEASAAKL